MKIIITFLILVGSVILALSLSPLMEGMHDFRTDYQTDSFYANTAGGVTNSTVNLRADLWNSDLSKLSVSSNISTDSPAANSYNPLGRALIITGLAAASNRTLTVSYDTPALEGYDAVEDMITVSPNLWIAGIIVVPLAGLIFLFKKK